jgi:uncharacterized protein (TIGR02117 family)
MNWLQMKQYRWVRWLLIGTSPLVFYLCAALIGSHVPVNANWRQPDDGVTIYITDNGYHTGLILPVSAEGVDFGLLFRATDLSDPAEAGNWLVFGWGDRAFYLNTPTWAEFTPQTALSAFIGSGGSLLHVDHLKRPDQAYTPRPIRLTRDQYRRLTHAIIRVARIGTDGYPTATSGYGRADVFYPAYGRYSALQTCNNWTGDMLAVAGVRVGRWTPFAGGVTRWFEEK